MWQIDEIRLITLVRKMVKFYFPIFAYRLSKFYREKYLNWKEEDETSEFLEIIAAAKDGKHKVKKPTRSATVIFA